MAAKKKEFDVEVCRIGYGFATITVEATSQKQAERLALEEAGNYEYSEKTAEYVLEGGEAADILTTGRKISAAEASKIEESVIWISRITGVPTTQVYQGIVDRIKPWGGSRVKDVVELLTELFSE